MLLAQLPSLKALLAVREPVAQAGTEAAVESSPTATKPAPVAQTPPQPAASEPVEPVAALKKAPAGLPPAPIPEVKPLPKGPYLPTSELAAVGEAATCEKYGTQVSFVSSPSEAAQKAVKEQKLLFLVHLAGNFEDTKFT
jgi:hypothetical protein